MLESNGFEKYIIADFYFSQLKMIIELDGGIHLKDEVYFLDVEKESLLINLGYVVLLFTDEKGGAIVI